MIMTVIRLVCLLLLGSSLDLGNLCAVDGEALGATVNAGAANHTDSSIKKRNSKKESRLSGTHLKVIYIILKNYHAHELHFCIITSRHPKFIKEKNIL